MAGGADAWQARGGDGRGGLSRLAPLRPILAQGGAPVAVDNLVTGDARNLAHLEGKPGFEFIRQDVTEPFDVKGPVDYVLNFASPASPFDYARLPIETLRVGSLGTEHGLQLARAKNAVFLQASTSEIYGDPSIHPQPESYWGNVNSIGPRSCYDEAKRYGEALVMAYHRTHGVQTRMVRISTPTVRGCGCRTGGWCRRS